MLEKTLESPLDCKEIQPVHPKGDQPWIFSGRTDAEAEAPILWPFDAKSQIIGKDPDAGKDWRQEEKGMAENEIVRWHQQHNEHEFEQALGDGEGQGSLAWWRTGKPGMLQSRGSRRVRHDWATEQQALLNLHKNPMREALTFNSNERRRSSSSERWSKWTFPCRTSKGGKTFKWIEGLPDHGAPVCQSLCGSSCKGPASQADGHWRHPVPRNVLFDLPTIETIVKLLQPFACI